MNASDVGMDSVLLQEDLKVMDHPVCYYSRRFNSHQCNYSTGEKEMLVLVSTFPSPF